MYTDVGKIDNVTVVLAGLTNSYADYIATYEEYQAQRYEAASTIYGPHTLSAYIHLFSQLATAMSQVSSFIYVNNVLICTLIPMLRKEAPFSEQRNANICSYSIFHYLILNCGVFISAEYKLLTLIATNGHLLLVVL